MKAVLRHGAALLGAAVALLVRPALLDAWGEYGHRLVGAAAVRALPMQMPTFFRRAGGQLAYLNPEPDRWRERAERELDPALDGAASPDHYFNLENVPADRRASVFAAPTRYALADSLRALGVDPAKAGALPFRILELTQRLRVEFRLWRRAPDSVKPYVEARIIDDAGILGHYVADASNPAHTSVHHNGWVGANPSGYTTDNTFHGRFESAFVDARVKAGDVWPFVARNATMIPDVRAGVLAYLDRSHGELTRLYDLEQSVSFTPGNTSAPHARFAAERLAAGATMLRDLWWTAWVTSGMPVSKDR